MLPFGRRMGYEGIYFILTKFLPKAGCDPAGCGAVWVWRR